MVILLTYIGFGLWFIAGYKAGEYKTKKEYLKKRSETDNG
jgi:hypothetical protein